MGVILLLLFLFLGGGLLKPAGSSCLERKERRSQSYTHIQSVDSPKENLQTPNILLYIIKTSIWCIKILRY